MRSVKHVFALLAIIVGLSLTLSACGKDAKKEFDKATAAKSGEAAVKSYINATVAQDAKKACSLMSPSAQKRALAQGVEQKLWKADASCEEAMGVGFKTRPVDDSTKEMVKGFTYTASEVTSKGMVVTLATKESAATSVGYRLVPKGSTWLIDDLVSSGSATSSQSPAAK